MTAAIERVRRYTKRCPKCGGIKLVDFDDKEASEYYIRRRRDLTGERGGGAGPDSSCKDCRKAAQAERRKQPGYAKKQEKWVASWRERNRKHVRRYSRNYWRSHYGQNRKYRILDEPTRVNPEPFRQWLETFFRLTADQLDVVGRPSGSGPKQFVRVWRPTTIAAIVEKDGGWIEDILRGRPRVITIEEVDAILTHVGSQDQLSVLYPLD